MNQPSGTLRSVGLAVLGLGAVAALILLLRAGQHMPRILVPMFVVWVLAPFIALLLVDRFSTRWSALTRSTLYVLMLVVSIGSVALYADDARGHRTSKAAAVYVATPPASVLVSALALSIVALLSRKRSSPL